MPPATTTRKSSLNRLAKKQDAAKVYLAKSLETLPRILNLLNRYPDSPTYGCADIYYWKYNLLDVANARFQEAAWLMALAYKYKDKSNPYYGNTTLRDWSLAAVAFWLENRNNDGSVTEVYPNERSFCATSFSTWAIAETLLLLRDEINVSPLFPRLKKTGEWLTKNNNKDVANQMAAAAAALQTLAILTEDKTLLKPAHEKQTWLLKSQTQNGAFPEYGGPDIGYQTITLAILTRFLELQPSQELLEAFHIGIRLVESVVDDNGYYNYTNTSRQTQYIYPSAFAYTKSPVIESHINGLEQNLVLNPTWMDDRYSIAMAIDYWQAAQHLENPQ